MPSADEPGSITPGMSDEPPDSALPVHRASEAARRSRIRRMFSGSRDLWRVVYRDPEHVAERLTLYTADRLGDPSREWAEFGAQRSPRYPSCTDRRRAAHALGACRPDRRGDLGDSVLRRARPRLPHVSVAGDADDASHRRALRSRTRETCAPRPRCSRCAACTQTSRPQRRR